MDQHPLYKPYGQILVVRVLIPVKVVTKFWRNVPPPPSGRLNLVQVDATVTAKQGACHV